MVFRRAGQRAVVVQHELRDHAQVELHGQSQVGLSGARLDDLRHHREVDGGEEVAVRIVHVGRVTEGQPFPPLADQASFYRILDPEA
jgi:hypothetical protein